jgi:hypothetical protein
VDCLAGGIQDARAVAEELPTIRSMWPSPSRSAWSALVYQSWCG